MYIFKELDVNLTKKINNLFNSNKFLLKTLIFITNTCDGKMYLLYSLIIPFAFPSNGLEILKIGVCAFGFQVPVYLIIKNLVKRNRPYHNSDINLYLTPPDRYSFPSGHCASSTLLVLTISMFEPWATPYLIIWMLLIYISRIALGLHYISDAIGGIILGCTSFVVGYNISQLFLW